MISEEFLKMFYTGLAATVTGVRTTVYRETRGPTLVVKKVYISYHVPVGHTVVSLGYDADGREATEDVRS